MSSPAEDFAADADADFSAATEPYRRELLAHCYRMTGSLHDADSHTAAMALTIRDAPAIRAPGS